jgi:hypothetical protein
VAAPGEAILDEVERAVVGKRAALELVLLALLADASCSRASPGWRRR